MAEALVSAATGAMQPVLGKLGALLGDDYKRLGIIHAEIESLTLDLQAMDALLDKMYEAEVLDPKDKALMKELRELSYDVDDNLDEFMAGIIADQSAKPDGFMDKIKGSLEKVKACREIAKAIEDLKKKQAIEVSHSNKRHKADKAAGASNTSNSSKIDDRALTISKKLVGLDGPKEEILQLLGDCESTQQQTKLVAIVGIRALGKTTIANHVYQDLKGRFQYRAFLSMSPDSDITRVMNCIYAQLIGKNSPGAEDLQTTITNITDFLKNERYLIVVDSIWKLDEWDVIKCAFPETTTGSKIIITTRIDDVAAACCLSYSGHIYNLRPLNMMQASQLLNTRLFNSEEKCSSDLEEISSNILGKCAGLPPAILAISGVLASKKNSKDKWEQVKDSVSALRNSSIETVVNIMSLSYMDLPPNLRTCLLYLSIFPKDHIIEKGNLIRRWIGEGFIQNQSGYTVQESGEMCFNELINRSLIQPVEIDSSFGGHEVKSCRVHDTVLDFIISKAVEENFVTIIGVPGVGNPDPRNKVRRLSLQNDGETPPGLVLSNARSLHIFGRNVKIPPLPAFPLLRVLDFEECEQLEDDDLAGIGTLLHLKYLRFMHAHLVTELPEELARLKHLEIHIHEYHKVMKIPEIIQQRLSCYVTIVADTEKALPNEILCTQGLRELVGLSVYMQSVEFLKGLGRLKNLSKLGIIFDHYDVGILYDYNDDSEEDYWKEQQEEVILSINKIGKASLGSLQINMTDEDFGIIEESWFPCPPYGLRELVFEQNIFNAFPAWIESLVNLEKLSIHMRKIGEEDIKILGALRSLRYLSIQWDDLYEEGLEAEAAIARAMEAHPNRPMLVWTDMD